MNTRTRPPAMPRYRAILIVVAGILVGVGIVPPISQAAAQPEVTSNAR